MAPQLRPVDIVSDMIHDDHHHVRAEASSSSPHETLNGHHDRHNNNNKSGRPQHEEEQLDQGVVAAAAADEGQQEHHHQPGGCASLLWEQCAEAYPPAFVIVGARKVTFDNLLEIREFEKPTKINNEELWYTEKEISKFMDKKDAKIPEWGTSDARIFNHRRRVLFYYKAMIQTDSLVNAERLLSISEEYSQRAKAKARKSAMTVARDVHSEVDGMGCSFSVFGSHGRVADYYIGSFLDVLNDASNQLCNSPLWI